VPCTLHRWCREGRGVQHRGRDPRTPAEWQEVVDGARAFLLLDDCRLYGLLTGGPKIDRDRCIELIERGRARGVVPQRDPIEVLGLGPVEGGR